MNQGDRIAQFILERIHIPILVESKEPLPDTIRGEGGFGSTGVTANVTANVSPRIYINPCYVGCRQKYVHPHSYLVIIFIHKGIKMNKISYLYHINYVSDMSFDERIF